MPPIVPATDGIDTNALRVLVTGFGPWGRYAENPSWLAVRSLHNTILYKDPPAELLPSDQATIITDEMEEFLRPQQIHITALEIPVNYQAVLNTVPGLHGRPPVLPSPNDPSFAVPPPPANGYDFIFHVGVAGRGPLRIERIGHKNGYRMKDGDGEYAPIVHLPKDTIGNDAEAELARMERMLASGSVDVPGLPMAPGGAEVVDIPPAPNRGFGKGYETFPDELSTEIDVPKLIVHLKESGIDVYSSMDAGHYLCDFVFYCSLAEARRQVAPQEKFKERNTPIKSTPVLFMHCPPVDQPLSSEQVTDAIQRVILWVCGRFHQPARNGQGANTQCLIV